MIGIVLVGLPELRSSLGGTNDLQVVGAAANGREALELIRRLRPQVVCMSSLDGLELIRQIMAEVPTPILVIGEPDGPSAAQVTQEGALELMTRPVTSEALVSRIRVLAGVKMFSRRPRAREAAPRSGTGDLRVVAIGASTGGPQALCQLLGALGPAFPVPVLCVQHISSGFLDGLVGWLAGQTGMTVRVARDREEPRPGWVYFPPEDQHLKLDRDGLLRLDAGDRVDGHRPSATVLLRSVAESFGSASAGVLLTGMGADGASGLLAVSLAGGLTLAQDERSSVVFGMARVAVEAGAAQQVLSLEDIAARLVSVARERRAR